VHARRALADEQRAGDLAVAPALLEQRQHLQLAIGEVERVLRLGGRRDRAGRPGRAGPGRPALVISRSSVRASSRSAISGPRAAPRPRAGHGRGPAPRPRASVRTPRVGPGQAVPAGRHLAHDLRVGLARGQPRELGLAHRGVDRGLGERQLPRAHPLPERRRAVAQVLGADAYLVGAGPAARPAPFRLVGLDPQARARRAPPPAGRRRARRPPRGPPRPRHGPSRSPPATSRGPPRPRARAVIERVLVVFELLLRLLELLGRLLGAAARGGRARPAPRTS
jgi:hypothetical protein